MQGFPPHGAGCLPDDVALRADVVDLVSPLLDGLVVQGNGLEAERRGVLQPQAGIFKQPRVRLAVLGEHEVRPPVGLPDRRVPGGVQDRRRLPAVGAILTAVEAHRADQVGRVPGKRLHGLRDVFPGLNQQAARPGVRRARRFPARSVSSGARGDFIHAFSMAAFTENVDGAKP